jgi:hypothetical protein
LVLVPLEIGCGFLAYETLGEVTSKLYFLAILLNLGFIILAIWHPTLAAVAALVLALMIVPYQYVLRDRLIRVEVEAGRIVAYVYEERLAEGEYPADLSGYEFHDKAMRPYIQTYRPNEEAGGFSLFFRVGTETTSHSYSPAWGWSYYPE